MNRSFLDGSQNSTPTSNRNTHSINKFIQKLVNSIFNSRIWWKIIQNAQWSIICFICPKLELWLALCMFFSTLFVCPFSHFHLFFILCRTFYIKLDVFLFNIIFIFPMNDAFFHSFNNSFNFLWQNIHFFSGKRYSNSKYHSFKIMLFYSFKKIIHFFEKSRIEQG